VAKFPLRYNAKLSVPKVPQNERIRRVNLALCTVWVPKAFSGSLIKFLPGGDLEKLARPTQEVTSPQLKVAASASRFRCNYPQLKTQIMNSTITDTINTLNDLIEILKDGQHGFKTSAEDVKAPELARVFERYATQRAEFAAELQARVVALGAKVEKHGSVTGSVHRGWINLKAALSTNEPHAVLAEAERGEDAAVAAYREALEEADLDQSTRDLISRQSVQVKAAHDNVKQLRDSGKYRKTS